ncbi:uncharacterized protein BXZ73DRAFT_95430 [Epithele typhae]|uniref:uncharacterized protein n=1 Tax=Epithele typhae TaxID=378194 RepID=UPI00200880CF|nr:uncharacterized protein BXZ73DRAFT_95430 [Epithele typhae]KAH9945910.1 hypothetical protein BXZ73DRAFT_95430 [Epithele typhae]
MAYELARRGIHPFGLRAPDEPEVLDNFGFKDQWLGIRWIQKNIQAFGGDSNMMLTGLSAHNTCITSSGRRAGPIPSRNLAVERNLNDSEDHPSCAPRTPSDVPVLP